jgi:hypothetical protein
MMMQEVIEFGDFHKDAEALLGEDGYRALIDSIAGNPLQGDVIAGTGGFRKMRFARPGGGKSGGVRTVYFYYDPERPIYAVAIYGKAKQENMTKAQQNALFELSKQLKKGQ